MKRVAVLFLLALVVFSFTCCQSGYALENPDNSEKVKIFDEPMEVSQEQSGESEVQQATTEKPESTESDTVQSKISKPQNETPTDKTTDDGTVYITPTGKRYHLSSTCGGKNSTATTLEDALNSGFTPCGRCAKE